MGEEARDNVMVGERERERETERERGVQSLLKSVWLNVPSLSLLGTKPSRPTSNMSTSHLYLVHIHSCAKIARFFDFLSENKWSHILQITHF